MGAPRYKLEQALVEASGVTHQGGWVANHDGNLSARLDSQKVGKSQSAGLADERFLITPTAFSKAAVGRENLLVVDGHGAVVSGRHKPFSELALHLYIYRQRPDVGVVVHAHPPHATALAVAGVAIATAMMPEPVVSLGKSVPLVPYAPPKSPEWTLNMKSGLEIADALLLEHHGVITCGGDLETAMLRMELVEHLARIQVIAQSLGGMGGGLGGGLRTIPGSDIDAMMAARRKAGLCP